MKYLKFKNRIYLGFAIIFLIMLGVTIYSNYKLIEISKNMELVYEHPFKVSNSIREIQIEIYKQARLTRDLSLINDINDVDRIKAETGLSEQRTNQYFNIIYSLYLGKKADIDSVWNAFNDWKYLKIDIYRLAKENKTDSLEWIIKHQNRNLVDKIIYRAKTISNFAHNKAKSAMERSIFEKHYTIVATSITILLTSLLVAIISYQITQSISVPIKKFVHQANEIFAIQSESSEFKFYHEEDLLNYTIKELKKAYQNIEQQNEEIKSSNEQLADFNHELEKKVEIRTNDLKRKEELLSITAQVAKVGGWEFDLKSQILTWSAQTYEIHELSSDFQPTIEKALNFYHGKSKEDISNAVEKAIRLGAPFDEELKITTAKGNTRDVRALGDIKKDDEGNPVSVYGAFQDITYRKTIEDRVKCFYNLIEKSLNEIYVFDKETLKFYFVNRGALINIGYSAEEMQKLTPPDIIPEYTPSTFKEAIKPLLNNEIEILRLETIHRRKNGSTYPVEIHLQITEYEGKKVFTAIAMDIMERKRAENLLLETNKSLEEMVYIASHDLQVPLVSMEGFATELLEGYAEKLDETGKFCLTRLQANARRMHSLVLSLLDISRLSTKKNTFEKFKLSSIIQKVTKDLSLAIEKQNAKIYVEELPELYGDKIRIESVFRNLIANSLNYGANSLSLTYSNNIINLKDNGIGVPISQLERIFNPGERLKKNNAEGVGMGLTFCKKVIELHNWKIWAESEGENKGTTIKIKIM